MFNLWNYVVSTRIWIKFKIFIDAIDKLFHKKNLECNVYEYFSNVAVKETSLQRCYVCICGYARGKVFLQNTVM